MAPTCPAHDVHPLHRQRGSGSAHINAAQLAATAVAIRRAEARRQARLVDEEKELMWTLYKAMCETSDSLEEFKSKPRPGRRWRRARAAHDAQLARLQAKARTAGARYDQFIGI